MNTVTHFATYVNSVAIGAKQSKDGYIRRSDVLFLRKFGNGTLAPGWVGC